MLFLLFGNMVLNVSFIHMLLLQCRLWCDAMEYYIGYKTISCRVVLCGDYHYYGMWGNSMWEITCGEYPVGNTLWVHLVGIPFIGYINREKYCGFQLYSRAENPGELQQAEFVWAQNRKSKVSIRAS